MTPSKLNAITKKFTRIATWAARIFDAKNKQPVTGIHIMVAQLFMFIAASFLIFLAIALTTISAIYSNLKETK